MTDIPDSMWQRFVFGTASVFNESGYGSVLKKSEIGVTSS